MPEEEKPATQVVTLPAGGSIPGIPGQHGPGSYIINWLERTITPVVINVEKWVEDMIEKPETAPVEQVPTEPVPTSAQTE